jgi:hypothetical protein
MQRRVELDLWYIANWSLVLDFWIVSFMDFRAEGLTAGEKLQNSFPLRLFFAVRGRKQYPRKSNMTFGYGPLRFESLQ